MSAEAALKTRLEQLGTTKRLHAAELEKEKTLTEAEETKMLRAFSLCAEDKFKY